MKTRDIVIYGGLAIAAYFLYRKFSVGINAAANAVAAPIANAWVNLTAPAAPAPQGSVVMPDGSYFDAANLTNMNRRWVGNALEFDSGGSTYALAPQVNGNYQATRVS